jgi:pilus assembly protein FimV
MSDPIIEEDGLISQDDIDRLMESSSSEEAQDKMAEEGDLADELGELSQDDIDSLLNSNVSGQADSLEKTDASATEDGEMELISQDDIDQLMNSNPGSGESLPVSEEDEEFEELSQDDIKALMGAQDKKNEEEVMIRQDDFVINESDADSVSDCLITQAALDKLMENVTLIPDPVIADETPPAETASAGSPGSDADTISLDISDDDAEDFLKPGSEPDVLELNDDREDVTQEDIDALLSEPDDDEEAEDDVLISQDDIDTLLMAADQEDEDVLGDLMDKGMDIGLDEDLFEKESSGETEEKEDEEIGNEADDEGVDEDENEDQVVLQGEDEVALQSKKKNAGSPRIKKKLVLAFASFLVLLGIAVPISYFVFFSSGQKPEAVIVHTPQPPVVSPQREVEIDTVQSPAKPLAENKNPGNMVLKDFIILAPDISKQMTYITADISIDYADQKASQEIRKNLSYYRDLIYDAIGKSLVAEKQEDITEAEILSRIETVLRTALPGDSINRVSFLSFKIS